MIQQVIYTDQAISREEYPDDFYPINCEGQFYMFPPKVAEKLLEVG